MRSCRVCCIIALTVYPGVAQLVARLLWERRAVSGTGQGETPQSLVTPAFAGLSSVAENGTKVVLTTGMTTDRKIFDVPSRRDIMAIIEYPGIAKLVSRLVWDQETVRSSRTTRTKIL